MTAKFNRFSLPETLPGATRFSDDASLASSHQIVATVKGMPHIWNFIRDALAWNKREGPARMPGDWGLVFLAFTIGRIVDMKPWHQRVVGDRRFWGICGFDTAPSYQTTWCDSPSSNSAWTCSSARPRCSSRPPRPGTAGGQALAHRRHRGGDPRRPANDCQPHEHCPSAAARRQARVGRMDTGVVGDIRRTGAEQPVEDLGCEVAAEGYLDRGRPRVDVRCAVPQTQACRVGAQPVYCEIDYTRVLPTMRTHPAYGAMRGSHQTYEHKHRDRRINFGTAPDCLANRPKRIGIRWQQLRANAAMLVEWVYITVRMGWNTGDENITPTVTSGDRVMNSIRGRRQRIGRTGGGFAHGPPAGQPA